MKKIPIIVLLFAATFSYAQHRNDALKQKLRLARQDSDKVRLLIILAERYAYMYPDTSLNYSQQALELVPKLGINTEKREITILFIEGAAFRTKGDYGKSLATLLKALQLAEDFGIKDIVYNAYFEIGISYSESGDAQRSLDYMYALKAHRAEIKWFKDDWEEHFDGYCSHDFLLLNKIDSARYYVERGYQIDKKIKYHWYLIYGILADLSARQGQYKKAISYIYPYRSGSVEIVFYLQSLNQLAAIYQKIGLTDSAIYYSKKVIQIKKQASLISQVLYASQRLTDIYTAKHEIDSAFKFQGIMLMAKDSLFSQAKVKALEDITNNEAKRRQDLATANREFVNKIRVYSLIGISVVFLFAGVIIWRNYRQLKDANVKIQKTLAELRSAQAQLIQSEKMASLGELTAGIAHEIQNPLNFVNNFSEVNTELIDEMKQEMDNGNYDDAKEIANDIKENEQKINMHGKRADGIVKGMLQHSKSGSGSKEATNINKLAEEYMRLAYQGLRAKDESFNAEMTTGLDANLPKITVIPQDIGRVLLNIFNNAFYAVNQKQKTAGSDYKPEVSVATTSQPPEGGAKSILIIVKDNGAGIPDAIKDKIMQPFFTTKPTGEGTGLGLSLTYDMVVNGHGGSIQVNSKEGEGSEFIIKLPVS